MIYNYLKIALRQFQRDKATSIINLFGLALAMAVSALIGLYIRQEIKYDDFFSAKDELFRVYRHWEVGNEWVNSPGELSETLMAEIPEVISATHIAPTQETLLTLEEKQIYTQKSVVVDSHFFQVFPFPFLFGDANTAFQQPAAAVLSASMSERLFGPNVNPVGASIQFNGNERLLITGVVQEDMRSHLSRDIYIKQEYPNWGWLSNNFATYVQVHPDADLEQVKEKIYQITKPHLELAYQEFSYEYSEDQFAKWGLQPITKVHLHSSSGYFWSDPPGGNIRYLYVFGLVAFLMLCLAIFNYTNLTTARATLRAKEIGVRKVNGAFYKQLIQQFLTESLLHSFIALAAGMFLAASFLPIFEKLLQTNLNINWVQEWSLIAYAFLGATIIGLLSGIYPALVLAGFAPMRALRNQKTGEIRKFNLRQVLVTAQFTVVIVMLAVLGVMIQQIDFMLQQELGFDGEQVLVLPHNEFTTANEVRLLENRIQSIPGVENLSISSEVPGQAPGTWSLIYKAKEQKEPVTVSTEVLYADDSILETWGVQLKEGRFFERERGADTINFVVNEAFIKRYKIKDPFNTPIRLFADSSYRSIVGIVEDFHFQSLEKAIQPLAITGSGNKWNTSVRISTQDLAQTIGQLEEVWTSIEPNHPMRYSFLDQSFAQQYDLQQRFRKGLSYATSIIILIALLGLFGLATFSMQRKRKEIGIRKVVGASISQLVHHLNREFLKLVGIAIVVAIPLAWYVTRLWLQNFAYHIQIQWWVFALASAMAVILAFLTVSTQSIKAALSNPAEAIKTE